MAAAWRQLEGGNNAVQKAGLSSAQAAANSAPQQHQSGARGYGQSIHTRQPQACPVRTALVAHDLHALLRKRGGPRLARMVRQLQASQERASAWSQRQETQWLLAPQPSQPAQSQSNQAHVLQALPTVRDRL